MGAYLSVHDNFLPEATVTAAYEVFRRLPLPPSVFYTPIVYLEDGSAWKRLARYMPDGAAKFACLCLSRILSTCVPPVSRNLEGFEFWVGVTTYTGRCAQLHCDLDEPLRRTEGIIRCPSVGTILHLGPRSGLKGGETLFDVGVTAVDESSRCFALDSWEALLAACIAPIVIPQREGRLIVFRGETPHAVAPIVSCNPAQPRVAFLANLWDRRPALIPTGVSASASHA